jgi:hypothetical protein
VTARQIAASDGHRDRPQIIVNQDPGTVTAETRRALTTVNWPPELFRSGGGLSRTGLDDEGRVVITPLTPPAIRAELAARMRWVKKTKDGLSPAGVPPIAVDDLATHADQLGGDRGVPVLTQVVTAPVFAPDGTLVTQPGYIPAARAWYEPVDGMVVQPVSPAPSWEEVQKAKWLLHGELLGDFPFDTAASRQHALGTLLLPFVQMMIDGPMPLHAADAATPGTGKGLLQKALMYPALGRMPPARPPVLNDEAELAKRLLAALLAGHQVIRWDNVRHTVDSATLSMVLTEPVFEDRVLGLSRDATVPVRAIFMINGNNLSFSQEIARRVVPVRLDVSAYPAQAAHAERPWERRQFRHPDLLKWAKAHRSELVWAALTLIQAWIAAGKPGCSRTLGGYEAWSQVAGGIVEHSTRNEQGVADCWFLAGLEQMYADAVSDRDEMLTFLEAWAGQLGWRPVTITQLLYGPLLVADPFGIDTSKSTRSQETAIGYRLGKIRGQVHGGFQVVKDGRMWRLRTTG